MTKKEDLGQVKNRQGKRRFKMSKSFLGEDVLSCSGQYTFMKGYHYSFRLEKAPEAWDVSWRSNIHQMSSDHFQLIALKPFFPTQNSPEL